MHRRREAEEKKGEKLIPLPLHILSSLHSFMSSPQKPRLSRGSPSPAQHLSPSSRALLRKFAGIGEQVVNELCALVRVA